MNDDLTRLEVRPGDDIRAEDHNALVRAISRRTIRGGKGVLVKQYDDHTAVSYLAPRTIIRHAWKPTMTSFDGKPAVNFSRGLINGIEPMIDEKKLSDADQKPLVLSEFDKDLGDCLIYAELKLDLQTWAIKEAKMIASAKPPAFQPFTARKLIAIANWDGTVEPRCYFDLAFIASNRKPSGIFRAWWFQGGVS
jgi:hypothetical protein